MSNIGIYGGAFNPPHRGHILLARQAIARLKLDKLIVVVSNVSPHKSNNGFAESSQRLEMASLAFNAIDKVKVSDIEIKRKGISYTVDTLFQIKKQYPQDNLYLIMGDDMFMSFETWRDFKTIFNLATVSVLLRDKVMSEAVLEKAIEYKLKYKATVAFIKNIVYDASSTEIRDDFTKNYTKLTDEVALYAIKNGLYSNEYTPLLEKLDNYLISRISQKRLNHIYGTRDEAFKLAKRYNADGVKAYIAGFFHDVTKELDYENQLALMKKYGIDTTEYDNESYKLMHAVTGAAVAQKEFCVGDKEILDAIRFHTTARADMSLLEKIVYIADYIEPNRDYEDVDVLRKLAYEDIDKACIYGLKYTIESLSEKGKKINKDTLDAYDFLIGGETDNETL